MRVFSSKMYGSGIRGDDDRPFRQFSAEFLTQGWYCRQIIDRNMEEPFDLRCVEIDRQDVIDPNCLKQISQHAGGDRLAPSVPFVGTGITHIRNNCGDALCSGPPTRVGEH